MTVGRVSGHRGIAGELTVRVASGDAVAFQGVPRVGIGEGSGIVSYDVERARGYRDRLVLKLASIDDPSAAEALRGRTVSVAAEDAPPLAPGEFWIESLVGLAVFEAGGRRLGRVRDVEPTGGVDLLRIDPDPDPDSGPAASAIGEPILVPLASDFVEVDLGRKRITVRAPDGLLDLNREGGR